jgi:cellobiose phosphorylase
MPSVTLACFAEDRVEQAVGYLKAQAAAARKAGSFHEYWTWEKYAGKTEPGGAKWYGETSAGYLEALLHGLIGLRPGKPGFKAVILEPRFPASWPRATFALCLPNRTRLDVDYQAGAEATTLDVKTSGADAGLPITLALPWRGADEPRIESSGATPPRLEREGSAWRVRTELKGAGRLALRAGGHGVR